MPGKYEGVNEHTRICLWRHETWYEHRRKCFHDISMCCKFQDSITNMNFKQEKCMNMPQICLWRHAT